MKDFILQIVSGLIVTILIAWFGIGKFTASRVIVNNIKSKKTGKWMIIIAVVLIIWGLVLLNKVRNIERIFDFIEPNSVYSFCLLVIGVILLIIGKIVAWFQKP